MKNIVIAFIIICISYLNLPAQTMKISYKTITYIDSSVHYTVNATYPQVDFGPDALMGVRGIAQDINYSLDTLVSQMIRNFEKDVSSMPDKTINGLGSSIGITSQASVVNSTLLTAQITEFTSIAGAAHPMTMIHSFNYSTISTGILSLTDLFKSNSEYLKYISGVCIKQLTEYAQKEGYTNINDMILQGASPDLKNFEVWNIKDDNLVITFNPYQVAPYVFGIQTASIPLSDMTSMIDPKGPLSFMFR